MLIGSRYQVMDSSRLNLSCQRGRLQKRQCLHDHEKFRLSCCLERLLLHAGHQFCREKLRPHGLCLEDDVLVVDGAFDAARLARAFEVSFHLRTVLLDFNVLRRSAAVGVMAVEVPFSAGLCRWLVAGRTRKVRRRRTRWCTTGSLARIRTR
jgi:hypothetical protein